MCTDNSIIDGLQNPKRKLNEDRPCPEAYKTFVGTSANAVRTQIWTALIAMLLIKILQQRSTFRWALSNLIALLRWTRFSYRRLWEWINRPFDTPPETPPDQLELFDLDSIPQST